jgi:SAM-dependent methyltransferase
MGYVPALSYDILTPLFDPLVGLFFGARQRRQVIDLLALQPGERLLDLGCGTGTLLLMAGAGRPEVVLVGVDVDPRILTIARRKIERSRRRRACHLPIHLINATADRLPFPGGSFAAVTSTLIFHHLPTETKRQALKQVYGLLAPGGRFLLVDFGPIDSAVQRLFVRAVRAFRAPEAPTMADNVAGRIPAFLRDAGFVVEEVAPPHRGIRFLRATKLAPAPTTEPSVHAESAHVSGTAPRREP